MSMESKPLRDNVLGLCAHTAHDPKVSETYVKLAAAGTLSAADADAYRDGALRLRIDSDTILGIEAKEKGDRAALIGILQDQASGKIPRDQQILGSSFTELAKQSYPEGGLEAIRKNIISGALSQELLDKLISKGDGYRAPLAALMREADLNAASVKQLAGQGIHSDLLLKLLQEKKAGRITSQNINDLMVAEPNVYKAVRERMTSDSYDKTPLSSEALTEIFKAAPGEKVLQGYFNALDRGAIVSQEEFVEILKMPGESRKAMEEAFMKGRLDRRAIVDLKATNYSVDEVRRYTQVLEEARGKGIDLAKLNEASEYIQLHRAQKSVKTPPDAGPAGKMEIAFLLLSQGLEPASDADVNKIQNLHRNTEAIRRELKLTMSESVEVDRFKRENPSLQVDQKTIEKARILAADRILRVEMRDALGAAAIMQQAAGEIDARTCLNAKEEVLKLARRHADANIGDLYSDLVRRDTFLELVNEASAHPLDKLKLTRPNEPESAALELSEFAAKRRAEVAEQIAGKIPTALDRGTLKRMHDSWGAIEQAVLANDGKNALVELITAQPELAWQVLQNTPNEQLARLSNDRFVELANSAKEHLSTLPQSRREELTRALVAQFEERIGRVESTSRRNFISSWLNAAAELPSVIGERKPATFNILQNLTSRDMARLSAEHLKQLTGSISITRMEELPPEKQARLLIDLLRESGKDARADVKDSLYKDIVSHITPEIIEKAPLNEVRWLSEELKKNLKSEPGLADSKPTGEIVTDIANKIAGQEIEKKKIDALIANLPAEERALALELLAERAPHLSQAGFIKQLKDFADTLRSEGVLQTKATQESRGRLVEVVKLYCFNDSTSNKALSYQIKKHTGLQVEVQVLKPGDPLPTDKGVLIEPLSAAPESMRKGIEAAANFRPATELTSFQKGLNFLHLAAADANPDLPKRQLQQMLADAKQEGRMPKHTTGTSGATSDAEFNLLKNKVQSANNDFQARTEAKTLLYFAHKQKSQGGPVQLHAMVMNSTLDVLSYNDMIEQAFFLQDKLATELKSIPEKTFFIVDEKPNSNHLSTELYRTATEQEGREFDRRFITLEQAQKMKGEGLTFVYLNDGIYSGTEVQKKILKLQELKEAHGGKSQVVSASFIGYKDGVDEARKAGEKAGIEVLVQTEYEDAYKKGAKSIEKGRISRVLEQNQRLADVLGESAQGFGEREAKIILGAPEWSAESYKPGENVSGAKVVSSLYLPYMRSNTTARLLGDLASYLDIPSAHIETRGELIVDDVKAHFTNLNDQKSQRAAVSDLLDQFHSRAAEEYSATMDSAFRPEQVTNQEEMRTVLKDGLRNFLEEHQKTEAALGLENLKVAVEFGSPPGSRTSEDGKTLTLVLDPKLADRSQFASAKTEIMRQLLNRRAQALAAVYPEMDPARFRESVDQVLKEKLFQVENPLRTIDDAPGIRRFTEVSTDLLVGSTPKSNKNETMGDSMQILKEKGVKTVIDLSPKENPGQKQWCLENGIEYKHMPIEKPNTLTNEQADLVLNEIARVKAEGGKVFLQDRTATDRAPAMVAAYRIAQGLSTDAAIAELAERFSFSPADKSKLTKTLQERAGRAPAEVSGPAETALPVGSIQTPAATAVRSPMSDEKLRLFIDRVENDLPSENFREALQERAKMFFSQEGSDAYQRAVRRTLIKIDPELKQGESKLTFMHEGQAFTPKSFAAEPPPGRFQTTDGKTLDLPDCKIEVAVSSKATAQEAAAAVAAEYNRLALEIQNTGNGASVAKLAEGEAALRSLKERLNVVRNGGEAAVLPAPGAQEIKIGQAVDLGGRVVEVALTNEGVRIGNDVISNKDLVKMAIEKKQKLFEQAKEVEERNKLAKEIENLKALAADIEKGETKGMREALAKHVPGELEAGRHPAASVRSRVVEGVGKAGAYLMIAAFVASLAVSQKASAASSDAYAPLKPR
ncbi:MAG: hypothetical protein C0469_15330 [Cyanobacteria bacterium DS2.3.42]|nr:hypothetical protein [Cyanobacteria bacterium DS2.3.42]